MASTSTTSTSTEKTRTSKGSMQTTESLTSATSTKRKRKQEIQNPSSRVILVRTAERVDRMFPTWIKDCFSRNGNNYIPTDLNLPIRLPLRQNHVDGFAKDPPITEFGRVTAQLVGRGLRINEQTPGKIFSSPALRCVQTAFYMLRPLENPSLKICIEPGLFEWTQWHGDKPTFMTAEEMIKSGYPVDKRYQPVFPMEALESGKNESIQDMYRRIEATLKGLLNRLADQSILIVAHGITMDAGARGLLGKKGGNIKDVDMTKIGLHYPYNSSLVLGLGEKQEEWEVKDDALPPISYLDFTNRIDHQFLSRA